MFSLESPCGASGLKVRLPGLNSTISVNFLFVLAAAAQLFTAGGAGGP